MVHTFRIEFTLENLKVIKLWYHLAQKDREVTRADNETITKIKRWQPPLKKKETQI